MTRTILVLLASFSMVACATTPREGCVGAKSFRQATVHYGDSELRVTPPVLRIHKTSDFTVRLNPSRDEGPGGIKYADMQVTVVGKAEDEFDVNNSWIVEKSASGKNSEMYWCAPNIDATYYYEVTVQKVGTLDPRVDVD